MALLLGAESCRRAATLKVTEDHALPERGALVVVEASAGEFFEARVLALEPGRLRVQRSDAESAQSVPVADAYPLPARALPSAKSLAICEHAASHWVGCRIESVLGASIHATTADGDTLELLAGHVLTPSAFTASNIAHRFEREAQELDFERQAALAGDPPHDASFRPLPHMRLVAKIGADWFTAYVSEVDDDALVVSLSERSRREKIAPSAVVAEPPYTLELHRGQFVLVRPSTQSEPWQRCMVRSYGDGELRLSDKNGTITIGSAREVIPLAPR
ncbi:MAG TPA: hypothetical protein VGI10_25260 [Polyangiaceae bacterium]